MRLFAAIPVPPDVRRVLERTARSLIRQGVTGRYVPGENYHVTLRFFGETEALPEIVSAMGEAACDARPFLVRLGDFGCFSGSGARTGVVHLTDTAGELRRLSQLLDTALLSRGVTGGRERFSPHITLGRSLSGPEPLTAPVDSAAFTATSLILYESTRQAGGMVYTPVHKESF